MLINYKAIVETLVDNSPYFNRLRSTPDLTEVSKQVIQNNAELFAAPSELFEIKNRVTASVNILKDSAPLRGRRFFAIGLLTSLIPITVIAAVAAAIFGKLLVAGILAGTVFLLCGGVKMLTASTLDPVLLFVLEPIVHVFKKSSDWTEEFAKRQDINALTPECRTAFEDAQAKVALLKANLTTFKMQDELKAIDLRKLCNAALNRAQHTVILKAV